MKNIQYLSLFSSFLLTIGFFNTAFAQKKIIDHTAYNDWKRIGDIQLSNDGKYSCYTLKPLRGDGFLYIINNETGKKDSIARGIDPQFSGSTAYLAFKITPGFDTLHTLELAKKNKDKWPKDSLGIWLFAKDSLVKIPKVKEFKVGIESDWLAYLSTANDLPKGYLSKKEIKKEKKAEKKNGVVKSEGKVLSVWEPNQTKKVYYRNVASFDISKNGAYVSFIEQQTASGKAKKDSVRIAVLTTADNALWRSNKRQTEITQVNFGLSNRYLVGLTTTDTSEKRWNAFLYDCLTRTYEPIIDTSKRFENNRVLSGNYKLKMMNSDQQLYFGVWDKARKEIKDTLLEAEKVKVDIWNWKDSRLQPQQLVEQKEDEKKSNLYAYNLNSKEILQYGTDTLSLRVSAKGKSKLILAFSEESYRGKTWEYPQAKDYYTISTENGKVTPVRNRTFFQTLLSPGSTYFSFFNEKNKHLYAMSLADQVEQCLTCSVKTIWLEDLNGQPALQGPQGIIGWATADKGVLIQAEHDIYYYNFATKSLTSITAGLRSQESDTNYHYTLSNLVSDSSCFIPENLVLTQFNTTTKAVNSYRVDGNFPNLQFSIIAGSNHNYIGFKKAKNAPLISFQKHSVADYPDLYVSTKKGVTATQISKANPQQTQYNWATAELISWKSYSGVPLQGIVYRPENFDANKSYPLLVYFYELYSDELHNHYAPRPTASVIHPTEYASAGYVVLIPDIRYTEGHPANGAYDCIMSGTDAVLKKYNNIDPKRLGLQGQSWGGYQTAQLITMTDRYAAAMAGAPVGNMFSAYGGIRWGSGLNRQFQYEHTQSRIGKTIWEAPELYIENSPIFHLPKVKTPLLIMHNDMDGAVPWYQSIEIFTGLRRLEKPVWMLNYNGDDHNLLKNPNRIDLSIRMRQFFDYYLLGSPMPLWLKDGLPATEKGYQLKYETEE